MKIEYKDVLAMLSSMSDTGEAKGLELDFGKKDMENGVNSKDVDYSKTIVDIANVEGNKKPSAGTQFKEMKIFQQAQPGAAQQVQSVPEGQEVKAVKKSEALGKIGQRARSTMARATADIKGIVSALEKDIGKSRAIGGTISTHMEKEKFVMDKLSPQDQISDLEKISIGIDQGSFEDDQIGVIREEVEHLNDVAQKQNLEKMSDVQRSVLMLRNERLRDVLNKLALNS